MVGYTFRDYNKEHMARAVGVALPISYKTSYEICNFIRHKNIADAKNILLRVTEQKVAVPFKRFNADLSHKTKIGPGSYPEKASLELIKLLESVEANAQFKGLSTSNLIIVHMSAHKAGKAWHYGRFSRRRMKRTHVEICVEEKTKKSEEKQAKQKGTKVKKE